MIIIIRIPKIITIILMITMIITIMRITMIIIILLPGTSYFMRSPHKLY
jgi:hypothetical protein